MSFQSTRIFLGRKWCEKSRRNFKNDILKSNVLHEIGTCFVPMLSIIIHRFLSSKCVEMPWRWKIIIIFIECIVDVKRIGFFGHFRVIDTITPLTLAINYFLTAKLYIYPFAPSIPPNGAKVKLVAHFCCCRFVCASKLMFLFPFHYSFGCMFISCPVILVGGVV